MRLLKVRRNNFTDSETGARNYAFLLLKFRPRSEAELRFRLKRKKFSPEIIDKVLSSFKEKEFIDDESFAKSWIQDRILKNYGARRIIQELKVKGITDTLINSQMDALLPGYPQEQVVRKLAKAKASTLREPDPRKAKSKVYAYLVRRGFAPDLIMEVLEQK